MALSAHTHNLSILLVSKTIGNGHGRRRAKRADWMVLKIKNMAVSTDMAAYEEGQLERPKWAGETPLSRLVGALISFKPLYSLLKLGARQVLIRSHLLSPLSLYLKTFICVCICIFVYSDMFCVGLLMLVLKKVLDFVGFVVYCNAGRMYTSFDHGHSVYVLLIFFFYGTLVFVCSCTNKKFPCFPFLV